MKKSIIFILTTLLCVSLISCTKPDVGSDVSNDQPDTDVSDVVTPSTSATSATVVKNDGNTVSVTADELIEIFDGNQDHFNKYYTGSVITFNGTIKSISKNQMTMVADDVWEYKDLVVIFEEGFCLVNPPQDMADYLPGDTVTFSGKIITATTHMMLEVHGPTKSDPTVWVDGSSLGIIE